MPKVALQPSSKEESEEEERQKKVVDVSDSDDFYEVFDQPLSPEMSTNDLDQSSQPLPSHFKEVATSEDEMGIQRKPRSTLQELLESQLGRDAPTKAPHTRLPTPPPTHPLRTDPVDLKRKRDNKGNEVIEGGKNLPPREPKNQRATKQPRKMQMRSVTERDKKVEHQAATLVWAPRIEVDGAPLLEASIRDFQRGTMGYVTNAMKQSLLLPKDMTDLRSIRQYEVFLGLKRDLAMVSLFLSLLYCYIFVIIIIFHLYIYIYIFFFFLISSLIPFQAIQATFRAEEMVNYSHRRMKEEGRRIAIVDAFQVAKKSNKDLKAKLAEEEKERKYAAAALSSTEKQVES